VDEQQVEVSPAEDLEEHADVGAGSCKGGDGGKREGVGAHIVGMYMRRNDAMTIAATTRT
jgi:hypothetical protein